MFLKKLILNKYRLNRKTLAMKRLSKIRFENFPSKNLIQTNAGNGVCYPVVNQTGLPEGIYSGRILILRHPLEPGCCCSAIFPLVTLAKSLKSASANLLPATIRFQLSLPICPV